MGCSPSSSVAAASSSMVFTSSAFGEVDMVLATAFPSKQSTMVPRQTLPAGMENSVMSVSQSALDASAWKSRLTRFSGASDISPL